tara:strand:+ start:40 stop:501 length:462 start_codon:yes stop_codon:yes gene_type:complete
MAEQETPNLHKDRNKILMQYAESSFSDALDEINASLESEKNHGKKLALLSAKSWVLRNKLYASLHDPYIYTLNEIENTDVFDDMDDEDQTAIDSLFDEEAPEKMVEVTILKSTTVNGKKLVKDTILEVTEENATKLVDDGKAKISGAEEPKES